MQGELNLDHICDELVSLLEDYLKYEDENIEKIRSIGMQLDQEGGMSLMREVGSLVQTKDPLKASWLNNAWDGIGYWMS